MKKTRFRAYQLGEKGSSFSYSVDGDFTLIEGRYNEVNKPNILAEMAAVGVSRINCLHITSWDEDHCKECELKLILQELRPFRVEYPGYAPNSGCGRACRRMIWDYCNQLYVVHKQISPTYVNNLEPGERLKYNDILYNPIEEHSKHNDNSVVKLFRSGRFTVLSLGDCEDSKIAESIMGCNIAQEEVDVMILAHHGADNGFTTDEFIKRIKPKIAVCSSNYDNQFEHPRQSVRNILYTNGVRLYTTKTGDVVVICNEDNNVNVYNYVSNNTDLKSNFDFRPKQTVPSNYGL